LHGKFSYIGKSFSFLNDFHWKNGLHWKITFIKKILALKNIFIEKIVCIEKKFHIQNVAFKIKLDIWCKLMYENFPFPLGKNYENDYIIKAI